MTLFGLEPKESMSKDTKNMEKQNSSRIKLGEARNYSLELEVSLPNL
jgi:hypothetical protein